MKFKILILVFTFFTLAIFSQNKVTGSVVSDINLPIKNVEIYSKKGGLLTKTDSKGQFNFTTEKESIALTFYAENFKVKNVILDLANYKNATIILNSFSEELSEIQIKARKRKVFELKRLKDVEGTSIFAGKKTEVILVRPYSIT